MPSHNDFQVIPDELLARATPAERQAYAKALRKHIALQSPLDFALAVRPNAVEYRHSRYISNAIAEIPPGGVLIIVMPPRHGKTYLVSETTPAWALARDPNCRILHAAYAHDFIASKIAPVVHQLVKANVPLTPKMHSRHQSATDFLVDPKFGIGSYYATGVGGPLTGMGADYLIIDDPIKNAAEAKSKVQRDSLWEWYTRTARTRLEPGGRQIVIGTRWHEDDLIGRIINEDARHRVGGRDSGG